MANSTNLAMPYIEASQAQKHVTHNAALDLLDTVVMLSVAARDLAAPPSAPAEGARYLIAVGATGAWSGHDGAIAAWRDGAWICFTPREGWLAWVADEEAFLVFDGMSWTGATTQNAARLGINTMADDTNRLAVASDAALFTHAGHGIQAKLNKHAAADTASILFQTNWSGRAEIGCVGDDDFRFKVSPDGATFHTGLTLVAAASGVPRIPAFTAATLPNAATAGAGALIYLVDTAGQPTLAYSDGSAWRRADGSLLV